MSLSEDEDFLSADEGSQTEEVEEAVEIKKPKDGVEVEEQEDSEKDREKVREREEPRDKEDEEEALAERIRERNLKIARKFSAELAKNIEASTSAPIPVKVTRDSTSNQPPAPPPTPALSSSFNNDEGSQYNWRIPPANSQVRISSTDKTPTTIETDSKTEQARLALDRLSESAAAQADNKNLFERVAEDLKKVSIRTSGGESSSSGDTSGRSAIPLISDLGSSLGSWGWGGASQLLASATQVTSQVTSVLESALLPSQEQVEAFQAELEARKRAAAKKSDGAGKRD